MERWWLDNVDLIITSSDFLLSFLLVTIGSTILYYLYKKPFKTDLKYIMIGMFFESFGWALDRIYSGFNKIYKVYGNDTMDVWYVTNTWISLGPLLIVVVGLVFILGPIASMFFSIRDRVKAYVIVIAFSAALYWFVYWSLNDALQEHLQEKDSKTITKIKK